MPFLPNSPSLFPDLSSDLEWMLQSGRARDDLLVEALVREHYAEVCNLAVDLLGDHPGAEALATRVLADAVLNAHAYPVGLGIQAWLTSLAARRAGKWRKTGADPSTDRPRTHPVAVPLLGDADIHTPGFPGAGVRTWLFTSQQEQHGENWEAQAGGLSNLPFPVLSELTIARAITRTRKIVAHERSKQRFSGLREILVAGMAILSVLFAGQWISSLTSESAPRPTALHTALVTKLVYVSPTPLPSPTPTPFPERALLYIAGKGDTLSSIAGKLGFELPLLQALNGFEPDQPLEAGQQVMLGLGGIPLAQITPTPVIPAALPEPLTTASESQEVFQRIFESERYFHTLWVEAEAIEYWPPGFVGPPKVERIQAWISRPSFSLVLQGESGGRLERVSLTNSGKIYTVDALTGKRELYSSFGLDLMQLDPLIQQLFSNFETGSQQEIARVEQIAGREALVMDWYGPETSLDGGIKPVRRGSYWVDTRTGVILRLQRFEQDPEAGEFLVSETVIHEIAYDLNLNNALFDPYLPLPSRFARNRAGDPYPKDLALPTPTWALLPGRTMLPRLDPPPDFDPSRSRLSFQWSFGAAFDNDQTTLTDIFAGRYYLGSIDMGDPNRLICARSPDGRKIAYSEWLEGPQFGTAPLRWLDLTKVNRIHQPAPEVEPQVLAFSPDSERLAFLGNETTNVMGVYILDLASGDWQRVLELWSGDNLLWSPDGNQLALTGAEHPSARWKLLVLDATSGELFYTGPIEIREGGEWLPMEDSPLPDWGLAYVPARPSGVKACIRPPE